MLQPEELWLFQQGLAKFQAVPMNDPLSYYQIAGVSVSQRVCEKSRSAELHRNPWSPFPDMAERFSKYGHSYQQQWRLWWLLHTYLHHLSDVASSVSRPV